MAHRPSPCPCVAHRPGHCLCVCVCVSHLWSPVRCTQAACHLHHESAQRCINHCLPQRVAEPPALLDPVCVHGTWITLGHWRQGLSGSSWQVATASAPGYGKCLLHHPERTSCAVSVLVWVSPCCCLDISCTPAFVRRQMEGLCGMPLYGWTRGGRHSKPPAFLSHPTTHLLQLAFVAKGCARRPCVAALHLHQLGLSAGGSYVQQAAHAT